MANVEPAQYLRNMICQLVTQAAQRDENPSTPNTPCVTDCKIIFLMYSTSSKFTITSVSLRISTYQPS